VWQFLENAAHGESQMETETQKKRGRRPKVGVRSATLTIKMSPEMLQRIENTVVEVQGLAKSRPPDKADVLAWMLSAAKIEDLRKKIDSWNAIFD
jgi:hypothetical protein